MGIRTNMLAAAAVLVTQSDRRAPDSSLPIVRRIVEQSIAATLRSWRARDHYAYMERDQDRRRDTSGRKKSEDVDVSRVIFVNEVPFEELLEHNGQPPSAEEQRKQKAKLDELKRETPEERAARLQKQDEDPDLLGLPLGTNRRSRDISRPRRAHQAAECNDRGLNSAFHRRNYW